MFGLFFHYTLHMLVYFLWNYQLHVHLEIKLSKLILFWSTETKFLTACESEVKNMNALLQLLPTRETAHDFPVLCDHQRVPGVRVVGMEPVFKNMPRCHIPRGHSCKDKDHQAVSNCKWKGMSRTWGERTLFVSGRWRCPLCYVSKTKSVVCSDVMAPSALWPHKYLKLVKSVFWLKTLFQSQQYRNGEFSWMF